MRELPDLNYERWPAGLVHERWASFTHDEREALMRYGSKPAPWETTPDTALRFLKCDPKLALPDIKMLDSIFRTAYRELTEDQKQ